MTWGEPLAMRRRSVPEMRDLVELLVERADEDAGDPDVRDLALRLRAAAMHDPPVIARMIHGWVQAAVRYVPETRETFARARYTAHMGAGDCDDHAALVAALARAAGLRVAIVAMPSDVEPRHVVAQLDAGDGAGWQWAETTIAAAFGEHPTAALRRLRATDRADLERL